MEMFILGTGWMAKRMEEASINQSKTISIKESIRMTKNIIMVFWNFQTDLTTMGNFMRERKMVMEFIN